MLLDSGLDKAVAQSMANQLNAEQKNRKSVLYCRIMNVIDFRYWFCDCGYEAPYGKVISADCKKHD